jgi:hypothetical protein
MNVPIASVRLLVFAMAVLAVAPATAQEFGVYLTCKGRVESAGKNMASHLDLALRRNSQLAMIESSDILPSGEKMRLEITPQFYTMTFQAPSQGSVVFYDWLRGKLLVWSPGLQKLHTIRISVDRQSAALEGDMRNAAGASVGRLKMRCDPKDNETAEPPKF